MDLLEGLNAKQIGLIRQCLTSRKFEKGEVVFREGDAADCFYIILTGQVEILRETDGKPVRLAQFGPNDVFGEMGLLINAGRTAAVRALEATTAYEIPSQLVEDMKSVCGAEPTLKFLQNMVCVLAERLRAKHARGAAPKSLVLRKTLTVAEDMEEALKIVEKSLPQGAARWLSPRKKLAEGEYLARQGDKSDGFYFIHDGALEVDRAAGDGKQEILAQLTAPIIAGEYGFFTGEARTASLRATEETVYTHFPAAHFNKLKTKYPDEALKVLFATARLAAYLLARE